MPFYVGSRRVLLDRPPVVASGGFTAFDKGFDFRASSGFVTDPASCTYVIGPDGGGVHDQYPTTRNSVTFGFVAWGASDSSRDRDSGIDPRLSGMVYTPNNGTQVDFRIDLLSAGTYNIALAMGEASSDHTGQRIEILDNTTSRFSISGDTLGGNFIDANGNARSAAAWPGSNTPRSITMATTTLIVRFGALTNVGSDTTMAHVRVTRTA